MHQSFLFSLSLTHNDQ